MESVSGSGLQIKVIPVGLIDPNGHQPRKLVDPGDLTESVRVHGILQPLVARPVGSRYELIAGERRLAAARAAGLQSVPCIIRAVGEDESAVLALVENLQRQDLSELELAEAYRAMLATGLTQEQLAGRLGVARSTIAHALRLLEVSPRWRSAMLHPDRRTGQTASGAAIRELMRLRVLDAAAKQKADAATSRHWKAEGWADLYGRAILFGDAGTTPRRTVSECRAFADRCIAWLGWGCTTFGGAGLSAGEARGYLCSLDIEPTPAWADWWQAAMMFDDLSPNLDRLTASEREAVDAAAGRVDFEADPFDVSRCEAVNN